MESERICAQKEITDLLLGRKNLSVDSIDRIPLAHDGQKHRDELYDLLLELRSDSIDINVDKDDYTFILRSGFIQATLRIQVTDNGKLDRLLVKPKVPHIQSMSDFISAAENLDASVGVSALSEKTDNCIVHSDLPLAVSSLVKVVVASIILGQIEEKQVELSQLYTISESDISILSAGLSAKNIGSSVTVKELLMLMLLFSDNSAMDILVKLGGENLQKSFKSMKGIPSTKKFDASLGIETTKNVYGAAWGIPSDGTDEEMREKSRTEVRWVDGLDYFIPLETINSAAYSLVHSSIYKELFDSRQDFFKGGSAPGVISALIASPGEDRSRPIISLAFNRASSFSLVEETYALSCVRKLFESEGYQLTEANINN